MAFLDRSQIDATSDRAPPTPGKALIVGLLVAVTLATVAIRHWVPTEALAPAIVTLLFGAAAATAGAAWLCSARPLRILWLDLAGSLTFIGVAISILIEPDQIAGLFTVSDQPER
jgi:hypothetical protein